MSIKKITLEDLKLESFLTEIDNTKLVKMQGGNGGYNDDGTTFCGNSGDCDSCDCPTDDYTNGPYCNDGGDDDTVTGPSGCCDTGEVTFCC